MCAARPPLDPPGWCCPSLTFTVTVLAFQKYTKTTMFLSRARSISRTFNGPTDYGREHRGIAFQTKEAGFARGTGGDGRDAKRARLVAPAATRHVYTQWLCEKRESGNSCQRELVEGSCPVGRDVRTHYFGHANLSGGDESAEGGRILSYTVNGESLGQGYFSRISKLFAPCSGVKIGFNYESAHVEALARVLDAEDENAPRVPRRTGDFELTMGQRMQIAHLVGSTTPGPRKMSVRVEADELERMAETGAHSPGLIPGRGIKKPIQVSRSVRSDGSPSKLQLLVAGPGTGKTAMSLSCVATKLCGRNWSAFEENVRLDETRAPSAMHPDAAMMRVALVVSPPGLVQQWLREATSMFECSECRPGGPFQAAADRLGQEAWIVREVADMKTINQLLALDISCMSPQIWIVAACSPCAVLNAIYKHELRYPAMALYDEGNFSFPAHRTHSGCSIEAIPFTLFLTATPDVLAKTIPGNTRHPLRLAIERGGGRVGGSNHTMSYMNNSDDMAYDFLVRTPGPAASSIARMLVMRLASGPPELYLHCRTDALCGMPAGITVFHVLYRATSDLNARLRESGTSSGISVVSTWEALRQHGTALRRLATEYCRNFGVEGPHAIATSNRDQILDGFITRVNELEQQHRASGNCMLDAEKLRSDLCPSLLAIQDAITDATPRTTSSVPPEARTRRSNQLVRMQRMLDAAGELTREDDECGVCFEKLGSTPELDTVPRNCEASRNLFLAAPARGGLTYCCGKVLCFTCCGKLPKRQCPFCRSTGAAEFSMVSADDTPEGATIKIPTVVSESSRRSAMSRPVLDRYDNLLSAGETAHPRSLVVSSTTQLLQRAQRDPDTNQHADGTFLSACEAIRDGSISVFDAVRCACILACSARVGSRPRILVFFQYMRNGSSRAAKACIRDSVVDAAVFDIEHHAGPGLAAFGDANIHHPVFLLCDTGASSRSIAGADLGCATAAIVVGGMCADHETQLLGRFMRMSKQRNRPMTRVFHICGEQQHRA